MEDTVEFQIKGAQEYNQLFHAYSKPLCNFLYKRYGDWEKAKDITQESFIKLWDNRETVSTEKAKNFLYKVANNAFLNVIAHDNVVRNYEQCSPKREASCVDAPDFLLEEEEFASRLKQAIAALEPKVREVFLLNRIEKKKYREVAEYLGISIKTVEKRMHLALVALRKQIQELK